MVCSTRAPHSGDAGEHLASAGTAKRASAALLPESTGVPPAHVHDAPEATEPRTTGRIDHEAFRTSGTWSLTVVNYRVKKSTVPPRAPDDPLRLRDAWRSRLDRLHEFRKAIDVISVQERLPCPCRASKHSSSSGPAFSRTGRRWRCTRSTPENPWTNCARPRLPASATSTKCWHPVLPGNIASLIRHHL